MVNVALQDRNVYEDFDVETDILFFKIGSVGLVSFHGGNYNIKKRMTAEEIQRLAFSPAFHSVGSGCYVNVGKISSIEDGTIYFGSKSPDCKRIPVSRWRVQSLRSHLVKFKGHQPS